MEGRPKPAEHAVREELAKEKERDVPPDDGQEEEADPEPEEAPGADAEPEEPEADAEPEEPEADAEPEETDADAEPEDPDADAEPEDPVVVLQRERDDYLALAQRTQADFENYRKRAAREATAAGQRAKAGVVSGLFPVVDNLERALASAGEQEEHLVNGVRLVHSELIALLERNGVEQFDPAGERFDPTFHEALSTRPDEKQDAGVVLDVVEKGYRANGAVLRPARVVVSG